MIFCITSGQYDVIFESKSRILSECQYPETTVDSSGWPHNVHALCINVAIKYRTNVLILKDEWKLGLEFQNVVTFYNSSNGAQKLQIIKLM